MTKITLGVGADAIEVEDGAEVPMIGYRGGAASPEDERGVVRLVDGVPCVVFGRHPRTIASVVPETGSLTQWVVKVDLDALRRERAPKPVTRVMWANVGRAMVPMVPAELHHGFPREGDELWTHRPGNTPEKQAAFDAAIERTISEADALCAQGARPTQWLANFLAAARALGYGQRGK